MPSNHAKAFPINNLEDNLLIEVLQRLPNFEFALQCGLVCKRWHALVSSHYFISCLRCQIMKNNALVSRNSRVDKTCNLLEDYLCLQNKNKKHISITSTENPKHSPKLKLSDLEPFSKNEGKAFVVGSCHDLLLCCNDNGKKILYFVYNPFSKHCVVLPPPPPHIKSHTKFMIWFICDPLLSHNKTSREEWCLDNLTCSPKFNFKVVLIENPQNNIIRGIMKTTFSSETGTWSDCEICMKTPPKNIFYNEPYFINVTPYNGMAMWITKSNGIAFFNPQAVDLAEQFGILESPAIIGVTKIFKQCLGICQGFVRLVQVVESGDVGLPAVCVWELKEFTNKQCKWKLMHKLCIYEMLCADDRTGHIPNFNAAAIHPDDSEMVYIEGYYGQLLSCNLKDKEIKKQAERWTLIFNAEDWTTNYLSIVAPFWPTPIPSINIATRIKDV